MADAPRIATLMFVVGAIGYIVYLIFRNKSVLGYTLFPLIWFFHEFVFYMVYYNTNRFSGFSSNVLVEWQQIINLHAAATLLGAIEFIARKRLNNGKIH